MKPSVFLGIRRPARRSAGFGTLAVVTVTGLIAAGVAGLLYRKALLAAESMRPARTAGTLRLRQATFERRLVQLAPEYAAAAGVPEMPAERVSWERLVRRAAEEAGLGTAGAPPELTEPGDLAGDLPSPVRVELLDSRRDDALILSGAPEAEGAADRLPLLSHDNRYPDGSRYREEPWPDIHFRYTDGNKALLRRNAWRLRCRFTSGSLPPSVRVWRLIIDEIPAQLALESAGRLTLSGTGSGGGDSFPASAGIEVAGGVYAAGARLLNVNTGRLAVRGGFTAEGLRVAGVPVRAAPGRFGALEGDLTGAGRWLAGAGSGAPVSAAVNFDLANFVTPSAGMAFYDCVDRRESPAPPGGMARDRYLRGALRCRAKLFITALDAGGLPAAVELETADGARRSVPLPAAEGNAPEAPPVLRVRRLTSGRPALELDFSALARDAETRAAWGLDGPEASLAVNFDYRKTGAPPPALESLPGLPALVLARGADLRAWPRGVSVVANLEIIFRHSFNLRAGADGRFPPASVFAPAVRYGTGKDDRPLRFEGGMSSPGGGDGGAFEPAFTREDGAVPEKAVIRLTDTRAEDGLPPVHPLHWLVTLERADGPAAPGG